MKKFLSLMVVLGLAGCGHYYDYGLRIGSSADTLKQNNDFYIAGDYEFVSILFRSEDEQLTISVQHPLHPVPEPEIFISQIVFKLDDDAKRFSLEAIKLEHSLLGGEKIDPIKESGETADITQFSYYAKKYKSSQLEKKVVENVEIVFIYNSEKHTIKFCEKVELVKRWSKFGVAMSL